MWNVCRTYSITAKKIIIMIATAYIATGRLYLWDTKIKQKKIRQSLYHIRQNRRKMKSHYPWKWMKILYLNEYFVFPARGQMKQNIYFHSNQKIILNCISLSLSVSSYLSLFHLVYKSVYLWNKKKMIFSSFFIHSLFILLLLVNIYLCLYMNHMKKNPYADTSNKQTKMNK